MPSWRIVFSRLLVTRSPPVLVMYILLHDRTMYRNLFERFKITEISEANRLSDFKFHILVISCGQTPFVSGILSNWSYRKVNLDIKSVTRFIRNIHFFVKSVNWKLCLNICIKANVWLVVKTKYFSQFTDTYGLLSFKHLEKWEMYILR